MRKEWFQYVRTVRERENRKRKRADKKNYKECSHKEAMSLASISWAKEKAKILKRQRKTKAKVTDSEELAV